MKGRNILLGAIISIIGLSLAIYLGTKVALVGNHPIDFQIAGRVTEIDSNNITLLMGRLVSPSEEADVFHENIAAPHKREEVKGYEEKNKIDENHSTYFIEAEDTTILTINDEKLIFRKSGRDVREAALKDISKGEVLVIEFGRNDDVEKIIIMEDID